MSRVIPVDQFKSLGSTRIDGPNLRTDYERWTLWITCDGLVGHGVPGTSISLLLPSLLVSSDNTPAYLSMYM